MKLLLIAILLSSCASTKVLVKDCEDLPGGEMKKCTLVAK